MIKKIVIICIAILVLTSIVISGHAYSTARYVSLVSKQQASAASKNVPAVSTTTTLSTNVIMHGDTSKKDVIFTFDGGATAESGDKILEMLAKHHVKGTFFLTGKMIEKNPDLVKRIAAAGHEIFNHTYDHSDLTKVSAVTISDELAKMESVLENTAGISSKPYFRAPYGAQNAAVIAAAASAGYESVYWTVDAMDWREPQGETAAQVKKRILSSVAPGTIYLMHIGDTITGSILDDVFTAIESRGYAIVSLTQGL